ncbi:MAG: inositol monophosphatase [Deltaproteobacteria bacterium]|jgi:myo-inositol-1(or 4)-monophosphatase|nr:inositol monophosphatase [Deltaproteobacteria bacterium]
MWSEHLDIAVRAAKASGRFLRGLTDVEAASAKGKDIKLHADKESERILLSRLQGAGIPILSEESSEKFECSGGLCWIIDPLDGSYNLFKGLRELCCVSVALWDDGKPVLGVVYRFATGDLYTGVPGKGAFLNGTPIHASAVTDISQASLATGFPVGSDFSRAALLERCALFARFKKIRMLGAASLMCAFVAQGCVDVYAEKGIFLWDVAAALAIVQAAGGVYAGTFGERHACDVLAFGNAELSNSFATAGDFHGRRERDVLLVPARGCS